MTRLVLRAQVPFVFTSIWFLHLFTSFCTHKRTSYDLLDSDLGLLPSVFVTFDKYAYFLLPQPLCRAHVDLPSLPSLATEPRELISSSEKTEINGTRAV